MIKPVATVAAVGVVGVLAAKLLGMLVVPMLAMLLGILAIGFKVILVVALVWLAFKIVSRLTDRPAES